VSRFFLAASTALTFVIATTAGFSQTKPDYDAWAPLVNPFESTSGGGVMIDGYKPVVSGNVCTTDFSVKLPDGAIIFSEITFDAVPVQGGVLCTQGKWRTKNGSDKGTTPFEVFIKDGVMKRSP
jgi:hypothetical protein